LDEHIKPLSSAARDGEKMEVAALQSQRQPIGYGTTAGSSTFVERNNKRKRKKNDRPASDSTTSEQVSPVVRRDPGSSDNATTDTTVSPHAKKRRKATRGKDMASEKSPQTIGKPLNGLILAVSTLDVKGERHSSGNSSYREVSSACTALGATVTAQVHNRVFALICNESAVLNLTQRVRKSVKKKHIIIDVQWIRKCEKLGSRVCYEEYLLNDLATNATESKQLKSKTTQLECQEDDIQQLATDPDAGWSKPVSLDCCCVCHDTGRECHWCLDCNVTLALKS